MKSFLRNTATGTPSAFIDIMRNVSMILLLLIIIINIVIVIVLNIVIVILIVILIVIKPITEAYRSGASEVSSGTGV